MSGQNPEISRTFPEFFRNCPEMFRKLSGTIPDYFRNLSGTFPKKIGKHPFRKLEIEYAHIEIVVAFLVVNFFGFLVITRNPGDGEVPG